MPKTNSRRNSGRTLPKGMKAKISTGGSASEISKSFKSTSGNNLYLKDEEEVVVAFLAQPVDFPRYKEHSFEAVNSDRQKRYYSAPCVDTEDCVLCERSTRRPVTRALAPVYNVKEKRMQFFRCNGTVWDDMNKRAERRPKAWLSSLWVIARQGTGTDTTYTIDREDEKVPSKLKYEEIDPQEILNDSLAFALNVLEENTVVGAKKNDKDDWGGYDDEDDDEDLDDDDDDDDDEDDEEKDDIPWDEDDEEEEKPRRKSSNSKTSSKRKPRRSKK